MLLLPPRQWFSRAVRGGNSRRPRASQDRRLAPAEIRRSVEQLEDRTLLTVMSNFNPAFGVLTVTADDADNVVITASGGNVQINGADPDDGTRAAGAIHQITVMAFGIFSNQIDLSGVTAAAGFNTSLSNLIEAGEGNDTITGSEFRDTINGGEGNDLLVGGAGDDQYEFFVFASGVQDDVIDESGGGIDFVCIFTETGGATLNLSIATAQTVVSGSPALTLTLGSGSTIENACANFGGNTLTGNSLDNQLNGGGTLNGGDGNDLLFGLEGSDDLLVGGAGNDVYQVVGSGAQGIDVFDESGGSGSDTINFLSYDNGNSSGATVDLDSNSAQSFVSGGGTFQILWTIENFIGSQFNDTIHVDALPNVTRTIDGADPTSGSPGDTLNVDLMSRPFTHTPGATGSGTVDVTLVGGTGTISYASVETLNLQNQPTNPTLTVSISPTSISEDGGSATGTVTRTNVGDLSTSLVVNLSSNDTTEATVPATVTILANEASATFTITAVDDFMIDGTQTVLITASSTGFTSGTDSVDVTEQATLTLTIDLASISESGGTATGTVSRSSTGDLSQPLTVDLTSNDVTEATVPATVTISAGQASATFTITAVDDALLDGTQTVTISVSHSDYFSGMDTVDVTDHESLTLTIDLSAISENGGTATGTVSRSNTDDLSQSLVVNLASNDTSEATVPATVTIPGSQSSVTFTITAVDDVLLDGTQIVTVSASNTDYAVNGVDTLDVTDNEIPPASVYVDDGFAGLTPGDSITDADPNTPGNQAATFGYDAYATIQSGINAVASGGTVHIIDGIYAESVSIAKPLTLNGTGLRGNVIIDPDNGGLANGITLTAGADNVTIQHLSVIDAPGNGISAIGVLSLALSDVAVTSSGTDGFHGESLFNSLTVTNSVFSQSGGDGIDISNSASADVILVDVTASGNDPGAFISGVSSFADTDGVYSGNKDHGVWLVDISGNVTLVRTTLNDNDADGNNTGDGLFASDGADFDNVAIGGNLVLQGVSANDSDGGGTAKHQRSGINIQGVTGTTWIQDAPASPGLARSTAINDNEELGISLVDVTGDIVISNVTAIGNVGGNLVVANSTGRITLTDSTYDASSMGSGVNIADSTKDVELTNVTASNNVMHGINIDSVKAIVATNVTALNNSLAGLRATTFAQFTDTDGDYRGNSLHGIQVIDAAEGVGLIRTILGDNAGSDEAGDGFNATDGNDADTDAIAGNLVISGATIRGTGTVSNHSQVRGIFVSQLGGALTLDESNSQANTVTGHMASGVSVSGGTTASITRGLFENNGGAFGVAGIELTSFSGLVSLTQTGVTANPTGIIVNGAGSFSDNESLIRNNAIRGIELRDISGDATLTRTVIEDNTGEGLFAADGADIADTLAINGSLFLLGVTIRDSDGLGSTPKRQETGVSVTGIGVSVFVGSASGPAKSSTIVGHSSAGMNISSVGSVGGLGSGIVNLADVTLTGNATGGRLTQTPGLSLTINGTDDVVVLNDARFDHTRGGVQQDSITYTTDTTAVAVDTGSGSDMVTVTVSNRVQFDLMGGDPTVNPNGDTLTVDGDGKAINVTGSTVTGTGLLSIAHREFENFSTINASLNLSGSDEDDLLVINASGIDAGTYQLTTDVDNSTGNRVDGPVVAFSGVTGLTWTSLGGNDELRIVNPTAAIFDPSGTVNFNGGTGTDRYHTVGGQAANVIHVASSSDGGTIEYTPMTTAVTLSGVERVTDEIGTAVRAFIFNQSAPQRISNRLFGFNVIEARDESPPRALTSIGYEFINPLTGGSLEVDTASRTGGGRDTVFLTALASGFDADIIITGDLDDTAILGDLPERPLNPGSGSLTVNSNDIEVNGSVQISSGDVTFTAGDIRFTDPGSRHGVLTATIGSTIALSAARSISMVDGTQIDAGSGSVVLHAGRDVVLGNVKTTGTARITAGASIRDGGNTHPDVEASLAILTATNGDVGPVVNGFRTSIDTVIDVLEGMSAGLFTVRNFSPLQIGAPGGINGVAAGGNVDVSVLATLNGAGLNVVENVVSSNARVNLFSYGDIAIRAGVQLRAVLSVDAKAFEDLIVESSSAITAREITLDSGTAGFPNPVATTTILAGSIRTTDPTKKPQLQTGSNANQITIQPGATDQIPHLEIFGGPGDDTYTFYIQANVPAAQFTISDSSGSNDRVIVEGAGVFEEQHIIDGRGTSVATISTTFDSGFRRHEVQHTGIEHVTVNGNDKADSFTVFPSSTITVTVNGGAPTSAPGDTLTIQANNQVVTFSPTEITVAGGSLPIQYSEIESVASLQARSINVGGLGGNDRFTASALPDGKTSIRARVQKPDGDGGFLVDSFFDITYQLGLGQNASIEGGGGTDTIEFLGGNGDDSFSIGQNGVMIGEQSIDLNGFTSLSLNPGGGTNVVTIGGGISIPNFINLVGEGASSSELRLNLAGTTGNFRINTNVASQVNEGSGSGVHIIEGFSGGGFVEVSGFGKVNVIGDGDDNLTVAAPRIPDPTNEAGILIGLLRVAGNGDGTDAILIGLLRTDGGSESTRIGFTGLNDVNVESSGNTSVEFHTATLTGAAAYHASLQGTDVGVIAGGSGISNPIVAGRFGNAWRVTNNGATNPKPINLIGGNRYEVRGGNLDDSLTINEAGGLITQPGGIYFNGGLGNDVLRLEGTAPVASTYQVGPGTSDGAVTHANAGGMQRVGFTGLEPVFDLVPGTLIINANNADNAINVSVGPNSSPATPTGLVSVDNFETYEFANKTTVTINGLAGQDVFGVSNLSSGFSGLLVLQGGDPADGDELILNGSAADDVFGYLPHPELPDAGVFTGLGGGLLFFGIEHVTVAGGLGNDSLTALGGVGTSTRSFTTPTTGESGSKIFAAAFATNSTSGTDTTLRAFGSDGLTPIGGAANDDSGPLNAALIAGTAVPMDEFNVTFVVGSGDGQNISEFDLVGGVIAPSEFTTEDESNNNSANTVNPIAVNIDQSGRIAQLGQVAPLSGDVDLIAVNLGRIFGGQIAVNIDQSGRVVNGEIAVNIDQSGRVIGGFVAVNIDQSGRVVGRILDGEIAVNIDQSGRVVGGGTVSLTLESGGQVMLNIDDNGQITGGQIAVNIDQSGRVEGLVTGGEVAVNINQSGRIAAIVNNDPNGNSEFTQTNLRILGSDGETVIGMGPNLAAAANAVITGPLEPGTYYIEITNGATSGESDYEIVIFGVFNAQAQPAGANNSSPLTGLVISPSQHGTGSITSVVRDDSVELTPHGNRESRLRFNNSSPLELIDFETVNVDPRDGDDRLRITGTADSDVVTFSAGSVEFNSQPFGTANIERFAVAGRSGDDDIVIQSDAVGNFEIDGGDGHDRTVFIAAGSTLSVNLPGHANDQTRDLQTTAVERFRFGGDPTASTAIEVNGQADAAGLTVTSATSNGLNVVSGSFAYTFFTAGAIEFNADRVAIHATTGDDTITVSETVVNLGNGLKPIGLNQVNSVRLFGDEGDDTFDVTPSATTSFFIDGGDPIGSPGDSLRIIVSAATLLTGPHNDEGSYLESGKQPVSFARVENTSVLSVTGTVGHTLIVTPGPNPSPGNAPANVEFPLGFLNLNVQVPTPGDATIVEIVIPTGGSVPNTYYKFGPLPQDDPATTTIDESQPHWYEFRFDAATRTGAQFIDDNGDLIPDRIQLHFVDGQRGDDDVTANGMIVDPGAPGVGSGLGIVGYDDSQISFFKTPTELYPTATYNSKDREFFVVWNRVLGGNEGLYGQRVDATTGRLLGLPVTILPAQLSADVETLSVAYNSTNNEYLVLWTGNNSNGALTDGEFEVFGRRIDAQSGNLVGATLRISNVGTDGQTNRRPEIIFAPQAAYSSSSNEYLVVWSGDNDTNDEFEVWGQFLDAATGADVGSDFRISRMGLTDGDTQFKATGPVVVYNSHDDEFFVTWRGNTDEGGRVAGDFDIYGQRINALNHALAGNRVQVSDMRTVFAAPAIAYGVSSNEYLVAWSGLQNGEDEIYGQRLNASTAGRIVATDFRISDLGPDGDPTFAPFDGTERNARPFVVYNPQAREYLVTWIGDELDQFGSPGNDKLEVFAQRLDEFGKEKDPNDLRISNGEGARSHGFATYSPDTGEYLVVWDGAGPGVPVDSIRAAIFGQRLKFENQAQARGLHYTATGGNDDLTLSLNPDGSLIQLRETATGTVVASVPASEADEIVINGGAGDDTLRILNRLDQIINVPGGITFDGGEGFDELYFVGDATALTAAYTVGLHEGSGRVDHAGNRAQRVNVENLEWIHDQLPGGKLFVTATSAANQIDVSSTIQIDNFPRYTFTNKSDVSVDAGTGEDVIEVSAKIAAMSGILSITGSDPTAADTLILSGSAESDVITYAPDRDDPSAGLFASGGLTIEFQGMSRIVVDGIGGDDSLQAFAAVGTSEEQEEGIFQNDLIELTPLGHRESRLRFNNSTPLELFDFENVSIDARDGVDQLRVFGTPHSDVMTFDTATVTLNGQTFGHANTEIFAAFGNSGDDAIGVSNGLVGDVTADGGDGHDLLSVVTSGGGPVGLALPGTIIDGRTITSVAVEAFVLNAGSNDLVVAGAPDAVSGVSITPTSASGARLEGAGRTYDLITTGTLTVAGTAPTAGSQLPLRQIDVFSSVSDDAITVSDTQVDISGRLPIGLLGISSVRVFGNAGRDTFDVTPSATTSFFIDGGDPIGNPGDSINLVASGPVSLSRGPENDEGQFFGAGLQPVSFDHVEHAVGLAIQAPAGHTLAATRSDVNPSPANVPSGAAFPLGFLSFEVHVPTPGAATTVSIAISGGATTPNSYFKFGPEPDDPSTPGDETVPHWYEFLFDPTVQSNSTGAEFIDDNGDGVADRILLHLIDGQRGDDDLTANGVIVDPGAPAQVDRSTGEIGENDFQISFSRNGINATRNNEIVYNSNNDEFFVVYAIPDSRPGVFDVEVFGQRIDARTGALIGNPIQISDRGSGSSSFHADNPSVAFNENLNEYYVVYQSNLLPPGFLTFSADDEIFGQRVNASSGALIGSAIRLSDMGPEGQTDFNAIEPRVAFSSISNVYLVVWDGADTTKGEYEVFGQYVDANTGTELATDQRISFMGPDGDTTYFGRLPAITWNSVEDEFLIVWTGKDNTGSLTSSTSEIFARALGASQLGFLGDQFQISDPAAASVYLGVAFNPDDNQYFIAWQDERNAGRQVFSQRLDGKSRAEIGINDLQISDASVGVFSFSIGIAYDRDNREYLVAWSADDPRSLSGVVPGESEVYGQRIDAVTGMEIGANDFRISSSGRDGERNDRASSPEVAYSPRTREMLVVWTGLAPEFNPPRFNNVYGQRLSFHDRFQFHYTGTNGSDDLTLKLDDTETFLQLLDTASGNVIQSQTLASVSEVRIEGGEGSDTLRVDISTNAFGTAKFVTVNGGILFDGGSGFDELYIIGDATALTAAYTVGLHEGSGRVDHAGNRAQRVNVENLEWIHDQLPGGKLFVTATSAANQIEVSSTIQIDNFPRYSFTNKSDVSIDAGTGEDVIEVSAKIAAMSGILSITGSDPTAADTLILSGSAESDVIEYAPDAVDPSAGLFATGDLTIDFQGMSRIVVDGIGGNDSLTAFAAVGTPEEQEAGIFRNDLIELTPLGHRESRLRFNNSTPLQLFDFENVSINSGSGIDQLLVFGTPHSDVMTFATATVTLNGQTFGHANTEIFAAFGNSGDDAIGVSNGLVGDVTADGGDGRDLLSVVASGGGPLGLALPGTIIDRRTITSVAVEAFVLNAGSNDLVVAGAPDAVSGVSITPTSASGTRLEGAGRTYDLVTTGTLTVAGTAPTAGSRLPLRRVDLHASVFDDSITVSDTLVNVGSGMKPIALAGVASVRVFADDGSDTIDVTPSATTSFFIDGGDPIGFGDTLNVIAAGATLHSGPQSDEGAFALPGLRSVSFDHIETALANSVTVPSVRTVTVVLANTENIVVVSHSGGNLLVRRGLTNLIAPTPLTNVDVLQIEGGLSADRVRLDRTLNGFFTGRIIFFGGAGNDFLDARTVNAAVETEFYGEDGNDTALGGLGHDHLDGGAGNDSLVGGDGHDRLSGGDGSDRLSGGNGNDILCGDLGDDRLTGDNGADLLVGHEGNDVLFGGNGEDTLLGLEGDDTLRGENGNDTVVGGENNDLLVGGNGHDLMLGEEGNDTVNGGVGYDRIDGGDGMDLLLGGFGHDTIFGGADRDTIRGGSGNDSIAGGDALDLLFGDAGTDTVHREAGIDTVSTAEMQLDDNLDDLFEFDIGALLDLCSF